MHRRPGVGVIERRWNRTPYRAWRVAPVAALLGTAEKSMTGGCPPEGLPRRRTGIRSKSREGGRPPNNGLALYKPAASRSRAARSVLSQEKSASSRPK